MAPPSRSVVTGWLGMDSTVARTAVIATIPVLVTRSDACSAPRAGRIQEQAEHSTSPVAASTAVAGGRVVWKMGGRDMAGKHPDDGSEVPKSRPDTAQGG